MITRKQERRSSPSTSAQAPSPIKKSAPKKTAAAVPASSGAASSSSAGPDPSVAVNKTKVYKEFGAEMYTGTVTAFKAPNYKVTYEDGDEEWMCLEAVEKWRA